MNEFERRERDREQHSRIMRELRELEESARRREKMNPYDMWEQLFAEFLPTRPKLRCQDRGRQSRVGQATKAIAQPRRAGPAGGGPFIRDRRRL